MIEIEDFFRGRVKKNGNSLEVKPKSQFMDSHDRGKQLRKSWTKTLVIHVKAFHFNPPEC